MNRIITIRLLLLVVLSISFHSCINEENVSSEAQTNFASKEYNSKSLWKEDEIYIKNVKKIFEQYSDKGYSTRSGIIAWDYAITAGQENTLEVPVIKNGKINYILLVDREGDRVFFRRNTDEIAKKFFNILTLKDRKEVSGSISELIGTQSKGCITYEKTVTWTNTQTGAVEHVSYATQMVCSGGGTSPNLPCDAIDIDVPCGNTGSTGSGGGGSGGNGGYPYSQEAQNFVDNCKKVKELTSNTTFKSNITNLEGKTKLKLETGYTQKTDGTFTYRDTASQTDNSNTLSLPLLSDPQNKNIIGYIHTHVDDMTYTDADGNEVIRVGIKMFSPADVDYFMEMLRNAQAAGRPLTDVYGVMVTSKGNYQIRFTGNQYQLKTFTKPQIAQFSKDYVDFMAKYPNDLETGFLTFISEKMNIKSTNLYNMDKNGTNYEIKLNEDKNKTTSGCPG